MTRDYLEKLNKEQLEAALHVDGPLLILAGAGSGKTSTMTCRIAHLIQDEGVHPYNILAVTFTNKAAGEMRDRVESLLGEGINMWLLTFHSACLRILRTHAEMLGYKKDFAVYDPTDQKTVMKNLIKANNVDDKKYTPAIVLSIISSCKEKALDPEGYLSVEGSNFKTQIIYDLYKGYEATLKRNNAMDFDDLLLNTVRLFEKEPEVLEQYRNRFKYIMVDEYQDTNYIQYKFVRMLSEKHHNLCVVGDDDQCIYQWRGADITNILNFEKDYPEAKVIKLEQNYRSYGNILAGAHSVIKNNRSRKAKKLWTSKDAGEKITYFRAENEKDEARSVALAIDRLHSKYKYNQFAVLYRINAQSRTFEEAFSAMQIPYRVLGGVRYYDRKEIKDILAYLRLVQNPKDDLALVRIINEPKRGIGDKTLEKLKTLANVRGTSLFETLCDDEVVYSLSAKSAQLVKEMVTAVSEYSAERANLRVSDIYDGMLVKSGYLAALEQQDSVEAESRIENLMEFKSVIYDYEKDNLAISIEEFMESIALMSDIDNHDADEDAVVLMTMHSAKGLEFPVVFMPGMEDGLFPSWRSLDASDGLEEERRLCYVGMTRAKDKLIMSSAETRMLYGRTDYTRESTFMHEIDKSLIEGDAVYEKKEISKRSEFTDGGAAKADFNPFDQLKYARSETKAHAVAATALQLAAGDKVKHAKFGEGLVIEADAKTVSVMFDSVGLKKLAIGLAPITKI